MDELFAAGHQQDPPTISLPNYNRTTGTIDTLTIPIKQATQMKYKLLGVKYHGAYVSRTEANATHARVQAQLSKLKGQNLSIAATRQILRLSILPKVTGYAPMHTCLKNEHLSKLDTSISSLGK
jgi:hypothetical protein